MFRFSLANHNVCIRLGFVPLNAMIFRMCLNWWLISLLTGAFYANIVILSLKLRTRTTKSNSTAAKFLDTVVILVPYSWRYWRSLLERTFQVSYWLLIPFTDLTNSGAYRVHVLAPWWWSLPSASVKLRYVLRFTILGTTSLKMFKCSK